MATEQPNDSTPPTPPEQNTSEAIRESSDSGLPPVAPPSGRFIIQLFLVPGMIVAVVVCVLIGIERFIGGGRSADSYRRDLGSDNPHVRWRAAADLSNELPRNPELSGNVSFAQDLAKRLEKGIQANDGLARSLLQNWSTASKSQREDFTADRNFVKYLTYVQGYFLTPVGISVLTRIAETEKLEAKIDPELLAPGKTPEEEKAKAEQRKQAQELMRKLMQERRHAAVLSLSLMGGNLKQFAKLPQPKRQAILQSLEQQSALKTPESEWAKTALKILREGKPVSEQVVKALALTAQSPDPYLRQLSAIALYFWDGPNVENILELLLEDQGQGVELLEKNPDMGQRSEKQFERGIRYQAIASLAAHGSYKVNTPKNLQLLKDMMNEKLLREQATMKNRDGKDVVNTDLMVAPTYLVLRAVSDLYVKQPEIAKKLIPDVEQLTKSTNQKIRTESQALLKKLRTK